MQAQRQAVEAERRTSAAQLAAKNKQLESTSAELTEANSRCADLEAMLWRAGTLIADLYQRIRLKRLLATQFKTWTAAVAWSKRERQLLKKAEDWCANACLQITHACSNMLHDSQ
jgi:chromosome segregation ATPase